jgi:hypothetical protein
LAFFPLAWKPDARHAIASSRECGRRGVAAWERCPYVTYKANKGGDDRLHLQVAIHNADAGDGGIKED